MIMAMCNLYVIRMRPGGCTFARGIKSAMLCGGGGGSLTPSIHERKKLWEGRVCGGNMHEVFLIQRGGFVVVGCG